MASSCNIDKSDDDSFVGENASFAQYVMVAKVETEQVPSVAKHGTEEPSKSAPPPAKKVPLSKVETQTNALSAQNRVGKLIVVAALSAIFLAGRSLGRWELGAEVDLKLVHFWKLNSDALLYRHDDYLFKIDTADKVKAVEAAFLAVGGNFEEAYCLQNYSYTRLFDEYLKLCEENANYSCQPIMIGRYAARALIVGVQLVLQIFSILCLTLELKREGWTVSLRDGAKALNSPGIGFMIICFLLFRGKRSAFTVHYCGHMVGSCFGYRIKNESTPTDWMNSDTWIFGLLGTILAFVAATVGGENMDETHLWSFATIAILMYKTAKVHNWSFDWSGFFPANSNL